MHVMLVASECTPFFKTGGLGDVVGSLPKEFCNKGIKTSVVLPLYNDILEDINFVCNYDIYMGSHKYYCGVFKKELDGVVFYFIDNNEFFCRDNLYGYDDDEKRFAFFNFATLELIAHLQLHVDVLHLHDWQSSMIATLYKERYCNYDYYKNILIVLTIHNIAFQGKCSPNILVEVFGLPYYLYDNGNVRNDNCFNMLKAGIVYSDYVTTVSPSYAKEIMTDQYGEGLQHILRYKKDHVVGILNGIDLDYYKPDNDHLEHKYCYKSKLQSYCNLEDSNRLLISVVTRLTSQKGIDLIIEILPELLNREVQVVILGSGDSFYENKLLELAGRFDNLYVMIGYDEIFAKDIYKGSDIFLMPSLFEPCGLAQMIAMRYGTIPVVRKTGGLQDSVLPYFDGAGTGFVFDSYDYCSFKDVLFQAIDLYSNKYEWNRLVGNAYNQVFDWSNSANKYIELFKQPNVY